MQLYQQLESKSLPLLEAYQTDLTTHDRRFIEENPGVPFLHYTRKYGTAIVPLYGADRYPARGVYVPYLFGAADRDHILQNSVIDLVRYHANSINDSRICQYFNGKTLREITLDHAVTLAENHARHIRSIW